MLLVSYCVFFSCTSQWDMKKVMLFSNYFPSVLTHKDHIIANLLLPALEALVCSCGCCSQESTRRRLHISYIDKYILFSHPEVT